jgi:hypothetical protein
MCTKKATKYVGMKLRSYKLNLPSYTGNTRNQPAHLPIYLTSHLGGVVVSVLATGPKGRGFEPSQGDGFLRAIQIRSTPSSRMGSKAGSHVVRFYDVLKTILSPTGMKRLNSHFLRPLQLTPRVVSGTGQSALVDKLGVSRSRSHLLIGPHRLSSRDSTTGLGSQCWDGSLTPSLSSHPPISSWVFQVVSSLRGFRPKPSQIWIPVISEAIRRSQQSWF